MDLLNLFKYKKPVDEQLVTKLTDYLQHYYQYLSKHGHHKIMVRISGDINSIVAGALLRQASKENIVAMIFDFGTDETNSLVELCKYSGLETFILKRGAAYQSEISAYQLHTPASLKRFYQRFINYHSAIQAENMKAVIVDTFDKSDRLLGNRPEGFYGHLMPFYSLYKSELYDLAQFLNIPGQFIPLTNYQGLLYPENIALTWDKIDPILFLLTEKQISPEEISQQFCVDLTWLKKLKTRIDKKSLETTVSQFII
ncbi:hypothetical protein HYW42_01585 [Candidatus Daviesbacteria bacterium]|nr:hypothetical protein [Candidatus Daviesbacteria bacterium]